MLAMPVTIGIFKKDAVRCSPQFNFQAYKL